MAPLMVPLAPGVVRSTVGVADGTVRSSKISSLGRVCSRSRAGQVGVPRTRDRSVFQLHRMKSDLRGFRGRPHAGRQRHVSNRHASTDGVLCVRRDAAWGWWTVFPQTTGKEGRTATGGGSLSYTDMQLWDRP